MHFIRQGQFDMCDLFLKEMTASAGVLPDTTNTSINDPALIDAVENLKAQFRQMYRIMKQLADDHDLREAIEWTHEHRDELLALSSSLEFNLHRLRFIQLLLEKRKMDAVVYSRQHFPRFGSKHLAEIERLMTCIIYDDITQSPYRYFCSDSLWSDIRMEFQRDFCCLLNMSADSPLYACVYVGTTALPIIMKVHTIMSHNRAEWSQQDELPVEIPLDDDLRYHSVFACPVSKEQATEANPPMMMPCGHVICKESLQRLSRNSRYGRNAMRFKCPYCPSESTVDQAMQVHF
ncbi:putative regulator of gluconeogenesis Rmd5 [Gongronella butleri]|nr:putative regulator of gluconeogenesis Rmd5 [Gongronella butleri]